MSGAVDPGGGAQAAAGLLHEARSSVAGVGAILRLVRQRLDQLAGEGRARCVEEVELLARTTERLERLVVRAAVLLHVRSDHPTVVDLGQLVAALGRSLQASGRRVQYPADAALPTIQTDAELLSALLEHLIDVVFSAGGEAALRIDETPSGARIAIHARPGAACTAALQTHLGSEDGADPGSDAAVAVGLLASRLHAAVGLRAGPHGGSMIVVDLPRSWSS